MDKFIINLHIFKSKKVFIIAVFFSCLFLHNSIYGEDSINYSRSDSAFVTNAVDSIATDSLNTIRMDSLKSDSAKLDKKHKKQSIEAPVKYSAKDSLFYDLENKKVHLFGDAIVTYEDIELKAAYIEFDMSNQTVFAKGMPDSIGNLQGNPKFKKGSETFDAHWIRYNFKTQKGFIYFVKTKQQEGTLIGDSTKRGANGHIHIHGGTYSTCDLDHPHFYIGLTKAKSIPGDKIVSGPAYLVVADIPLPLFLPFGFFPNTNKNSSGILIPTWGEEPNRGFFLSNGGFYFAINDYVDANIVGDVYSKGTWGAKLTSNYRERYKMSGNFSFDYQVDVNSEIGLSDYSKQYSYKVNWNHRQDQKANPYQNFSALVDFGSSSYDKRHSYDVNSYLTSDRHSSVSYSYRWTSFNLSSSLDAHQDIIKKQDNLTLPSFSLSSVPFYPFRKDENSGELKWYENITVNFTSNFQNTINNIDDSLLFTRKIFNKMNNGLTHTISPSIPFKLSKYFTLTPSISYNGVVHTQSHTLLYNPTEMDPATKTQGKIDTIYNNDLQYAYAYYPSVSLGSTPKLYGMYIFSNSKIKAIRHAMSPSASISFTPDVSNFMPNYYRTLYLPDNKKIDYSIFDGRFGGTPNPNRGKNASINLALNNTLEMKYMSTSDTSSEVKKISLLKSLNFSTNYNVFVPGDTCHFTNIVMGANTTLFSDKLNLDFSSNFDPYTFSESKLGGIHRLRFYELDKHIRLARLTSASFSLGTSFASSEGKKSGNQTANQQTKNPDMPNDVNNPNNQFMQPEVNYDIPWSIRIDYGWTYSKPGNESSLIQTSRFSGDLSVTKKWKIGASSGYDFTSKQVSITTLNISRDLHCWEMHFTLVPFGPRTMYNFTINAKASMLKDLKYTQQSTWQDRMQ
jgi:hypothetical protein